jgi:hypothetical protein
VAVRAPAPSKVFRRVIMRFPSVKPLWRLAFVGAGGFFLPQGRQKGHLRTFPE